MKWFKHMTRSLGDSSIEKLIHKFGIVAYGVYFGILETIAGDLSSDNVKFEINHGIEVLAYKWKIDTLLLGEIIQECFSLGLLELTDTGGWACYKLVKYVDDTMARNPEVKKMTNNPKYIEAKRNIGLIPSGGDIRDPEESPTKSDKVGESPTNSEESPTLSDQIRLDYTRLDKNTYTLESLSRDNEEENFNSTFIPATEAHGTEDPELPLKACALWFNSHNELTATTLQFSKREIDQASKMCHKLSNNEELILSCNSYYWEHFRDFWFYTDNGKRHSFGRYAGNISEVVEEVAKMTLEADNNPLESLSEEEMNRLMYGPEHEKNRGAQ